MSEKEKYVATNVDDDSGGSNFSGKPSPEQLELVYQHLSKSLPRLFVESFDYNIYHQNIIFENRILGKRTV